MTRRRSPESPIPVLRETGGEVFAGTINQNGSLEVEVEKAASDTMLSKIIYSVEEAQAKKGKLQRFSDAFGVYYTPAMFVLGVLVATVPPLFAWEQNGCRSSTGDSWSSWSRAPAASPSRSPWPSWLPWRKRPTKEQSSREAPTLSLSTG